MQDGGVPCRLQVGRVREALRLGRRVQSLLGAPLGRVQEIELLQPIPVLAVETHDLLRGEHAPVVGGRVVAEPEEQRVRRPRAVGRRVEEDTHPREILRLDEIGNRAVGGGREARRTFERFPTPMWYETTARSSRPSRSRAAVR